MKQSLNGLLVLVCGIIGSIDASAQKNNTETYFSKIKTELKQPESNYVLVAAHRGDWRNAPENSIQAIERAIAMGVDIVEIDVQLTKDNQLVLMHDKTLDRTTSGKGKVADYTLAEIRQFILRSGCGSGTRQRIPTFEECMLAAKGKVFVNVDKGYDYFSYVYEILEKTGTTDQAIIKSEHAYQKVKTENGTILDKVIYMPMYRIDDTTGGNLIKDYFQHSQPVAIESNFRNDTAAVVKTNLAAIKNSSAKIWFNSLRQDQGAGHDDERSVEENNPEDGWGWLVRNGATIIQTDRPKELLAYLKAKKLHD